MTENNRYHINELKGLIDPFETRGMDLDLERMKKALAELGNPCDTIPAIQIVGTNGKGSIASFIESVLKGTRIKTGATTSPHLTSWCERIKVDGQSISLIELKARLKSLQVLAKKIQITPFELITLAAIYHFHIKQVDLLILEVGLGGRLDATTAHALRPIIAIGGIGFDHCKQLGNNLTSIAKEKAAVISEGCSVISAHQNKEVKEVIESVCFKKNANLCWVEPISKDWKLGLDGEFQRSNAAVARESLLALERLGWRLSNDQIRAGFSCAKWPGRLQKLNWKENFLLVDAAHNEHAAKQLSLERVNWQNESKGVYWILGIQSHKNAPAILRNLLRQNDKAWIVPIPGHKSWRIEEIIKGSREFSNQLNKASSTEEVLEMFLQKGWPSAPPVITGSLYLIGNLLEKKVLALPASQNNQ